MTAPCRFPPPLAGSDLDDLEDEEIRDGVHDFGKLHKEDRRKLRRMSRSISQAVSDTQDLLSEDVRSADVRVRFFSK